MSRGTTLLPALLLAVLIVSCGDTDVQFSRGLQAYERGQYAEAMEFWEPLAAGGHGRAQYNMGILYFKGEGVVQDYDEAMRRFRDAADRGAQGAALSLAVMYAQGFGTDADPAIAYKWARVADNEGSPEAAHWRATLQRQLTAEQIKLAEEQAAAWRPSH